MTMQFIDVIGYYHSTMPSAKGADPLGEVFHIAISKIQSFNYVDVTRILGTSNLKFHGGTEELDEFIKTYGRDYTRVTLVSGEILYLRCEPSEIIEAIVFLTEHPEVIEINLDDKSTTPERITMREKQ